MSSPKWITAYEKHSRRILSLPEAKEISNMSISNYKRNIIMHATLVLELKAMTNVEGMPKNAGASLSESEVEQGFFQRIESSATGITKDRLTGMKMPPYHVILWDEKFASIWSQYVFLVVTNRHPKFTPKMITLRGRTNEIVPQEPFDGFSKNCRNVSEELERNAIALFDNPSEDSADSSTSQGQQSKF